MPLCNTQPCYNEGICEAAAGTFRCICAQSEHDIQLFTVLFIVRYSNRNRESILCFSSFGDVNVYYLS